MWKSPQLIYGRFKLGLSQQNFSLIIQPFSPKGFSPINSIKTNVIERTTSFYCLAFPPGEAHRVCTFLKRRVSVRCTYTMVCAIPESIFLLCKMKTLTSSLIISVVDYLHETVNTSHLYVMGKNHSYDKIQMTNVP